jgi:hypothetical protein
MKLNSLLQRASLLTALIGLTAFANTYVPMDVNGNIVSWGNPTSTQRHAWLQSGVQGFVANDPSGGTPGDSDIADAFGDTWLKEGELTAAGTNDLFTITLNSGNTWGNGPLTGTWSIDSSFWSAYGRAVISMHVGNGGAGGNPDWFLWEVTGGATSGTFHYEKNFGNGGGLSNLFLWGGGDPELVPDAGATAILVGLGLITLALFRRKSA